MPQVRGLRRLSGADGDRVVMAARVGKTTRPRYLLPGRLEWSGLGGFDQVVRSPPRLNQELAGKDPCRFIIPSRLGKVRTKIVATARAGVARSGRPQAVGRGGGRRLPAQLLARHSRGARRHAHRRSARSADARRADQSPSSGPRRPEDPPGDDPRRRRRVPLRRRVHASSRDRDVGRPPSVDLHLPRRCPTTSGRATTCSSPTARWRWIVIERGHGRARLKVTLRRAAPVAPGDQPARRGAERQGPHRQGPARPRLDGQASGRVCRPLVRPAGRSDIVRLRAELDTPREPCADRRQDREAAGRRRTSTRSSPRPTR